MIAKTCIYIQSVSTDLEEKINRTPCFEIPFFHRPQLNTKIISAEVHLSTN